VLLQLGAKAFSLNNGLLATIPQGALVPWLGESEIISDSSSLNHSTFRHHTFDMLQGVICMPQFQSLCYIRIRNFTDFLF